MTVTKRSFVALAVILWASSIAWAQSADTEQLTKVSSIDVVAGLAFRNVGLDCAPDTNVLESEAELVFRRSGIAVADKEDLLNHDFYIKLTGFKTTGGLCVVAYAFELWRLELLCDEPEHMRVVDPTVLASFVAFCSESSRHVFFRRHANNYRKSIPTLFRDDHGEQLEGDEFTRRWSAYRTLLEKLGSELPGSRWKRNDLGSVLQHYGFRTPWLDVVRNLYTAIWFATHGFETRGSCRLAQRSTQAHGWLDG